jgi:hypothetical protein
MRAGGCLLLATVAALLGVPSVAFAASPELTSPSVTPTTGDRSTPIVLSVRYDGTEPVTVVTAEVAGLAVPMALASGTTVAGTWTGTITLPPGAWWVTFTATTTAGIAVSEAVTDVTIRVGSSIPTDPTAPTPSGTGTGSTGSVAPIESGQPAPVAPSVAPMDGPKPAPATTAPPTGEPPAHPAATFAPQTLSATPLAEPRDPDATPRGETRPGPSAPPEPTGEQAAADMTGRTLAVLGLVGVAALAIVGSTLVVVTGARPEDGELPAEEVAMTILARRTLRRARQRLPEDQIVAAIAPALSPRPAQRRTPSSRRKGPPPTP